MVAMMFVMTMVRVRMPMRLKLFHVVKLGVMVMVPMVLMVVVPVVRISIRLKSNLLDNFILWVMPVVTMVLVVMTMTMVTMVVSSKMLDNFHRCKVGDNNLLDSATQRRMVLVEDFLNVDEMSRLDLMQETSPDMNGVTTVEFTHIKLRINEVVTIAQFMKQLLQMNKVHKANLAMVMMMVVVMSADATAMPQLEFLQSQLIMF